MMKNVHYIATEKKWNNAKNEKWENAPTMNIIQENA